MMTVTVRVQRVHSSSRLPKTEAAGTSVRAILDGMARTWLSVTVELLGGRGEELWPWPGRIFAVGPSHTFMDLANAINDAFARWDRSHLSMFTLDDGRVITDQETGAEMGASIGGDRKSVV